MGIIANQFRAQIEELQAKHEEVGRLNQASMERCFRILDKMKQVNTAMLEDLENA